MESGFQVAHMDNASACNAGDLGWIPGLGRSPGEGIGNPLQYSCLENLRDRRAWLATVHRVAKSRTWLKWLGTHAHLKSFRQETEFKIKFIWLQSCVSCIDE